MLALNLILRTVSSHPFEENTTKSLETRKLEAEEHLPTSVPPPRPNAQVLSILRLWNLCVIILCLRDFVICLARALLIQNLRRAICCIRLRRSPQYFTQLRCCLKSYGSRRSVFRTAFCAGRGNRRYGCQCGRVRLGKLCIVTRCCCECSGVGKS